MDRLNPELTPFLEQNKLSEDKVEHLVWLKDTVDRLATKQYTPQTVAADLEKKFGSRPNLITWGDYFQAEVATNHHHRADADFLRVCQMVYYDLIAAALIFSEKPSEFFKKVAEQARQVEVIAVNERTAQDNEILHLAILGDYFHQLGLHDSQLIKRDRDWFTNFENENYTD